MEISLSLLCFLQLGDLKSANKVIITVFLQFGERESANKHMFAACLAIRRAKKSK